MMCCSGPAKRHRRPARTTEPAHDAVTARADQLPVSAADGCPDSSEQERHILVQFPSKRGEFREVRWSEDPRDPLTMDGIKKLLRRVDPSGECASSSDFDVVDDDGDVILAPSTWPPGTRVVVSLEGKLNATCSG